MSHVIAVAGKGGVGKTTLCGILIEYLSKEKQGPILAVDADANSNLNEVLGVDMPETLGEIREELENADMKSPIPAGMSKADYAEYKLSDALAEEENFDLLVMGRTQGKGCYCFVNGLLQTQLARVGGNYPYMVVDNEAGMEHISRGILPSIDTAILVSDPSKRGLQAAARIRDLIGELGLKPDRIGLIVNRVPGGLLSDALHTEIDRLHLELLGVVPHDDEVSYYDSEGRPTVGLPEDGPVKLAMRRIMTELKL